MTTKKSSLLSLYFTIFNDSLTWGIVLTLFAPMLLNHSFPFLHENVSDGVRTLLIGLLLSIFGLGQFLSAPMLGALSDHIGRKRVLLISLWGSAISSALTAISISSFSLFLLFLSRFLAGSASGNIPIAQASIADLSSEKTKAKNLSLVGSISGIAWIIGPPIGGKLADPSFFNFSTPLWVIVISFAINALLVHFQFKETYFKEIKEGHGLKEELKAIRTSFRSNILRVPLFVCLMEAIGWFFFIFFYPTFFVQKFGLDQSDIGNYSGYLSIWFLGASLFLSRFLSHKLEPKQMIFYPLLVTGSTLLISLFFSKASYFLFTFPFIAIGGAISWIGIMSLLSNLAGEKNQGKIFGVQQSLQSIALFISPLLSGFLSAGNDILPLTIGGIALIFNAFYYYFFSIKKII